MIIETKRSNLVFRFDPRDGDIRERVTGAIPTVVGAPIFGRGKQGFGVRGVGTGYLEWAANATWDVTNVGTFVVHYLPNTLAFAGASQFMAGRITLIPSTRNGFCFTANSGSPALSLADADANDANALTGGTPTRTDEPSVVVGSWNAGGGGKLFLDGERTNTITYTNVPSPSGQVFRVAGFDARACLWPILGVYLFNIELTEQEIAQFYEELIGSFRGIRSLGIPSRANPSLLSSSAITLIEKALPGRVIPNIANPAKQGTATGSLSLSPEGFALNSGSTINVGDVTALNSANAWSLEAVVNHQVANGAGSGIISKTTSTNSRIALEITSASNPAGIIVAVKNGSDTYATFANVVRFGQASHYLATYNGGGAGNTDRVKLFVDGAEQSGGSFTGTIPATGPSLAGTQAIVGDVVIGSAHQYETGIIHRPCAFAATLTPAQAKARFLEWARVPVLEKGNDGRWLLAAVGGVGASIPDHGWISESATTVTETVNGGQRVFNSSGNTAGFRARSMRTVGTWKFLISSTGNACEVDFIRGLNRGTNTGYTAKIVGGNVVLALQGGATLLTGSSTLTSGAMYWVWITRTVAGKFDVWTRAVNASAWTYEGTATDTTVFSGGQFGFVLGTNSQFARRMIVYPGPIAPGDVPALDLAT